MNNDESAPDESVPDESLPDECRPTSEARIAANRVNAQHSTGPRSAEGKARSSRSSTVHGAYAVRPDAISRGAFAEDADEVECYLRGLVDALAPRDAIEMAQARQLAQHHLRFR